MAKTKAATKKVNMKSEKKARIALKTEDLPDVLEVHHIRDHLVTGHNQAYELCNSGQFHVVRVGNRIKVSKTVFLAWLYGRNAAEIIS